MTDDRTQQSSFTTEMPTVPPGRAHRRSRRTVATIAAALIVLGAGTGAVLAVAGGDDPAGTAAAAADRATVATVAPAPAPALDTSADVASAQDDPSPVPSPAAPGHLVVSTSHLNLGQNLFSGTFEVRNDGESPIDWAWDANHSAVSAAPTGGTLAPGETAVVEVTVHWQQLANGGYMFQTHVTGGDQQLNVLVSGTKQVVVNPGVQLPNPQIKP